MMTPGKLGRTALRRWYLVWLIGGIVFSLSCFWNLFFSAKGRSDPLTYVGLLVPVWWFGCAAYCARRLRTLPDDFAEGGEGHRGI
jgi:hypothetical protein